MQEDYEQGPSEAHLTHLYHRWDALRGGEGVEDKDFHILDTPELRTEYVRLTDRLMAKTVEEETDVIIFLDKSARPLAWLMRELWPVIGSRDDEGKVLSMPAMKFLNIDREQWGAITGRSEGKDGGIDIDRIPDERIAELRSIFTTSTVDPGLANEIPTVLDHKKVMVVDEVRASGDTLAISTGVIKKAFPDMANLTSFHWMGGDVRYDRKSGGSRITTLPVWYSDRDKTGRGVADRDTTKSLSSPSARQRYGAYWLSTRFRDGVDEKGLQLRKECAMLARELREHRIPYIPGPIWPSDQMIERIQDFNGMPVQDFIKLRKRATDEKVSFPKLYREYYQDLLAHQ